MPENLQTRYRVFHNEMIHRMEWTAAVENHWLWFTLVGWEMLLASAISHYLLEIEQVEARWPYAVLWLAQVFATILTVKLVSGRPRGEESPLEPLSKRIWVMFFILCFNVAVLNILAEQPLFTFLPALAALSSFGFTVMATFLSPRFTIAGLTMFVIGILMARLPHYAFLIYGGAWWAILQVLAIIFLSRRRRLLLMGPNSEPTRPAGSPNS